MDFFAAQERARLASRRGVLWFSVGVIAIFLAVDLMVSLIAMWFLGRPVLPLSAHLGVFAVILITVTVGVVMRKLELSAGGDAVARLVGGRRVQPDTEDLLERRLLNVVEEMAIASGVSVPGVYLLEREEGINAFAAGYSPNEAIVAVTRGTLTQLSREQLQGVIGHEFSHILNGDMSLNIHLLSWISGLLGLFLLGRFALRLAAEADDAKASAPLFILGLGLCLAGFAGMIFGRLMQAAVSRQREFLADASAVQFTRNPDGIGGALRRIAGYDHDTRLQHPNGETLSYLCFGAAVRHRMAGLFATHPPIETRIASIYGRPMPAIIQAPGPENQYKPSDDLVKRGDFLSPSTLTANNPWLPQTAIGLTGGIQAVQVAAANDFMTDLDPLLDARMRDPAGAQDVIATCLLLFEPQHRQQQLAFLERELPPERFANIVGLIEPMRGLADEHRIEVLELALPALSRLSPRELDQFIGCMQSLALVDESLSLRELLLLRIVEFRLRRQATSTRNARVRSISHLSEETRVFLSALARESYDQQTDAFRKGIARLQADGRMLSTTDAIPPTVTGVSDALGKLRGLSPMDKSLLLAAAAEIILFDGNAGADEILLWRACCAALDVPAPPVSGVHG